MPRWPHMLDSNRPGPSRAGYVLGAALVFLSVTLAVGGVLVTARTVSHRVKTFQRVGVPGTGQVHFADAGFYTIARLIRPSPAPPPAPCRPPGCRGRCRSASGCTG